LLERAARHDFLVIEDDYESETSFRSNPTPALKSLDTRERVIYTGSLSKTLAPGLRLGYLVGPEPLIREARALRRLMVRHPASNNQRSVALFLERGYHDALVMTLTRAYEERSAAMVAALDECLPGCLEQPTAGGSCHWIRGPATLDARQLREIAAERGVLLEPGDIHFLGEHPPQNFFRLGYSSIPPERIRPGVQIIAELIRRLCG
jgi:GntR family transcriptional regulator/MocR family aminotransferase